MEKILTHWTSLLSPISSDIKGNLLDLDPAILNGVSENTSVLAVTFDSYRWVLNCLIQKNVGALDFFANPFFQNPTTRFYYSKEVLRVLNLEYDISTVFFPRGVTRRDILIGNQNISKRSFFELHELLLGGGRIIVVYPFHVSVHREDPYFGFLTGNYEFYRVNMAQIESDQDGNYVLSNFRGRDFPTETFRPILAPLGLPIKRVAYRHGEDTIHVDLGLLSWSFEHMPFRRYSSPLYVKTSQESSLPEDFLREARLWAKVE
jgi:hypothetical protein